MTDSVEDLVLLNTFFDALDAGKACRHLEENEIRFVLQNLSAAKQGVSRFQEGPAVQLDVLVNEQDLQRARTCLRETMHLFPEREVGAVDHGNDGEEVLAQAAACDALQDANAVQTALTEAGIWSVVQKIVDDEDVTYVTYSVEVKGKNIERAMEVVERWGETL